jgi:hypothetical protein
MPTPEKPVTNLPLCEICGEPCDLQSCKIDWNGKPVHEECLVDQITGRKPKNVNE